MSYRLRRKTRPEADVEIFGGPLDQKRFEGGMNLDVPASEIAANELAYAANIICHDHWVEPRSGTIQINDFDFNDITPSNLRAYAYNPLKIGGGSPYYRHAIVQSSEIRYYGENPYDSVFVRPEGYHYSTNTDGSAWNPGSGDTTMVPYRRGFLVFTKDKISYAEYDGAFQINAAKPVHGVSNGGSGTFKYRYLVTLSRIVEYGSDSRISDFTVADRYTTGAEVVHESPTNGAKYATGGVSTSRQTTFGEVLTSAAIASGSGNTISNADLKAACSSAAGVTDDLAAKHFTHVTLWRTADIGEAGLALGNNEQLYYWVADVPRSDIFSGSTYSDVTEDKAMEDRGLLVRAQGFDPMPAGSCAEVADGLMFVSDRSNASLSNYMHYCVIDTVPENFGYYFKDVQKWNFKQAVRAMRANGDILSVFCEGSSHICNITSFETDLSRLQSVPFLNYIHCVDFGIGIKDWGSLDSIDQNTMIAVCSDGSVRKWDTTKWGDDLAYDKVSSEIAKIVPASPDTYARGSVGKYYNGAYYLWFSQSTSDTATTKCLRYGFGKKAGSGWTWYTDWRYPTFKTGVLVAQDHQGVDRLIVIDGISGKFYWVETFTPFTGAVDTVGSLGETYAMQRVELDADDYFNHSGSEIACDFRFRELIGSEEQHFLFHEETYLRWRKPIGADYRTGLGVSLSAYLDGSNTAAATVENQPKTAAIKFMQNVCAKRVQLGVSTLTSGWRFVGVEGRFRSLDKIDFSVAGDNSSSASTTSDAQFQADLATNLNHWLTRRETDLDRATGLDLTASGTPTLTTGPDSKSESAYVFAFNSYTSDASNTYSGDFSLSFFIKSVLTGVNFLTIAGTTPLTCKFTNATTLSFSGIGTVTVSSVSSGWFLFYIKRVGSTISVYQNGVLKGTLTSAASLGGGDLTVGGASAACMLHDLRVYSDVKSTDCIDYYYDDVLNNQGDLVMPQV